MCGRYALHANPEVVALQFGSAASTDELAAVHASAMRLLAKAWT